MSLVLHFVRHGAHDGPPHTLTGRDPDVRLSFDGIAEVEALAGRLARRPIASVLASPQPRTLETAELLSRGRGVTVAAALDEIDFGRWAGERFADLEHDPAWRTWNAARDRAATPAGETMADVADRVADLVDRLLDEHASGAEIVLVSHCDVIRACLCRAEGRGFDRLFARDLPTASLTTLEAGHTTLRARAGRRAAGGRFIGAGASPV